MEGHLLIALKVMSRVSGVQQQPSLITQQLKEHGSFARESLANPQLGRVQVYDQ